MQTSKIATNEQLAGQLARFIGQVMKGDQSELIALIAELELTMAQMRGLFMLEAAGRGLALTELAPSMGLSVPAAGRAVDGLVRDGFVARSEDPDDRRIKRLALTDEGRATLRRVMEARLVGLRRFAASLGDAEREALSAALEAVFAHWDNEQPQEAP
ncbi:MAG TPA: MarR family transcriptional regulator [Conexibacter sp.]